MTRKGTYLYYWCSIFIILTVKPLTNHKQQLIHFSLFQVRPAPIDQVKESALPPRPTAVLARSLAEGKAKCVLQKRRRRRQQVRADRRGRARRRRRRSDTAVKGEREGGREGGAERADAVGLQVEATGESISWPTAFFPSTTVQSNPCTSGWMFRRLSRV